MLQLQLTEDNWAACVLRLSPTEQKGQARDAMDVLKSILESVLSAIGGSEASDTSIRCHSTGGQERDRTIREGGGWKPLLCVCDGMGLLLDELSLFKASRTCAWAFVGVKFRGQVSSAAYFMANRTKTPKHRMCPDRKGLSRRQSGWPSGTIR